MDALPAARPRLTPGIPAGGVAAIAVTVLAMGAGLIMGEDGPGRDLPDVTVRIGMDRPFPQPAPAPMPRPDALAAGEAVDMRAIANAVKAAADATAKAAVAKADAMEGRSGDIRYLDRQTAGDGTNRLAASAVAPAGLRLADVNGTVRIKVDPNASEILFTMVNSRKRYNLDIENGLLWVTGPGPGGSPPTDLEFTVPKGTPLLVNNLTGSLVVAGDLDAPARLEVGTGSISIDRVTSARVRVTGMGEVKLGQVDGPLALQLPGAGSVKVGQVRQLFADLNGAVGVKVGQVTDGLTLSLPGAGEVDIGTVAGAVAVASQGAGRLTIADGTADRFAAGVSGVGSIRFGGTAADPRILMTGMGSVALARHTGQPKVQKVGPGTVSLSE